MVNVCVCPEHRAVLNNNRSSLAYNVLSRMLRKGSRVSSSARLSQLPTDPSNDTESFPIVLVCGN